MAFVGPIEDRLAIRERVEAYCDAVFRKDAEDWIAMSAYKFAGFFGNPGHIVVSGDTAEARTYTTEYLERNDGVYIKIFGSYEDKLVKKNGAWVFSSRAYTVLRSE